MIGCCRLVLLYFPNKEPQSGSKMSGESCVNVIFSMNPTVFRERGPGKSVICLPTQIRFPIGGERVTCHGSKLTNSLATKQLELSTRTWSGRAPWKDGKLARQSAWCQCSPRLHLGEHWRSRGNKTHCFPWDQSLRGYGTLQYGDVHEKFNFLEIQELKPFKTCQ